MMKTYRAFTWIGWVIAWAAFVPPAMLASANPASAIYRAAPGDIVEVVVRGFPELRQRVPIRMDGTIALTQAGAVAVAGLTELEINARVQQALTATAFRQRATDGHDDAISLEPDEIAASIAEYRPVYVTGNVDKSGEQPYRTALNVRQAIAIAGGIGRSRSRTDNPTLAIDLNGNAQALWTQYAHEQAHLWRLRKELGIVTSFDRSIFSGAPLADSAVMRSLDLETATFEALRAGREREEAFLKEAVSKVGAAIVLVSKQQSDEAKGTDADVQDLQTVLDLMAKGNVTSSRVNDARRAVLMASTRKLQTAAELLRLRHQQDELAQQLAQSDDQHRVAALQELQAVEAETGITEVKIQINGKKLHAIDFPTISNMEENEQATITVFRSTDHLEHRILATQQTELEPGDVVQVAFPVKPSIIQSLR